MAKGDNSKLQNAIDYQSGTAQNVLNNQINRQGQLYGGMYNNYGAGVSRNLPTYDSVMGSYNNFLGGSLGGGTSYGSTSASGTGGTNQPAVGGLYNSDANGNYPAGFQAPPGSAEAFIANWQQSHPAVGADPNQLIADLQAAGFNASPFMYGDKPSDNEISLNGKKFKIIAGTGTNQSWYQPGTNDSPGGGMGGGAIAGWENMAQTGGFSPQDIQDIRARAVAPIRSMYSSAQDELARGKELAGGYMPNLGASQAKLAREQGYAASDAMTNADAAIAQLKQQGQLYGLTGLTNAQLGALAGQTSMYGANPGLSQTFGNQVLASSGQGLQAAGLQNQIMDAVIGGQGTLARQPGMLQSLFPGGVPSMMQSAGQGANAISNMFGQGGPGNYGSITPGQGFGGPGTSTYGPGIPGGYPGISGWPDAGLPSTQPTYGYEGIQTPDLGWSNLADPSMNYYDPNAGGIYDPFWGFPGGE